MSQSRLSELIAQQEKDLLSEWLRLQNDALAARRERVAEVQLRSDSQEFLRTLSQALSEDAGTKIINAASELARNAVIHAGRGSATIEVLQEGSRLGLRLVFEDHGPGIPDIELALKDGYTSGSGLGLGLGGSKRLCQDFSIESEVGVGTRVTIARWKA